MELQEALLRSSTMPRARSCVAPCLQALKRESCLVVLSGQEGCSCAGKAFTAHSSLIWGLLTWDTRRELVAFTSHHYLRAQTAAGQPSAFGRGCCSADAGFGFSPLSSRAAIRSLPLALGNILTKFPFFK